MDERIDHLEYRGMNKMQLLKRRFFAMRNGAVADSMRKAGAPYRIIFGLNIPQIVDIAREFGPDRDLADQLRVNVATRESLLIAPMMFPREELTEEIAHEWLSTAMTPEVVDMACLKLIRYLPEAGKLIEKLYKSDKDLDRYAALRLGANILPAEMDLVEQCARAEAERQLPLTLSMVRMILDDIAWRKEEAAEEEGLE